MAVNVTLQIPNSVYRLAQITAKITSRPIEQVLSDVLTAANPLADDLPPALQAEIDSLAQLNDAELRKVARASSDVTIFCSKKIAMGKLSRMKKMS
ncbi:MAG: hypothetical protein HZC38_11805 [Chloroflexi bacterium]|nr:hypothetical protein [Chloroflexota bacterium]